MAGEKLLSESSFMALRRGFEPLTCPLGDKRSISIYAYITMAYKAKHYKVIHSILLTQYIQLLDALINHIMHTMMHTVMGWGGPL